MSGWGRVDVKGHVVRREENDFVTRPSRANPLQQPRRRRPADASDVPMKGDGCLAVLREPPIQLGRIGSITQNTECPLRPRERRFRLGVGKPPQFHAAVSRCRRRPAMQRADSLKGTIREKCDFRENMGWNNPAIQAVHKTGNESLSDKNGESLGEDRTSVEIVIIMEFDQNTIHPPWCRGIPRGDCLSRGRTGR